MARFQQYEIMHQTGNRWELLATFHDFALAQGLAQSRGSRVRLMRVTYEDSIPVEQEVIAEVGAIRTEP
ncbi:MAG TPA: hypothetical protein VEG30_11555 [Terriglobales bacterium]|nr:hypothetical protein [Terriglobales bacterium]